MNKHIVTLMLVAVLLGLLYMVTSSPFKEIRLGTSTITGSTSRQIVWMGMWRKTEISASPLLRWSEQRGLQVQEQFAWHSFAEFDIENRNFAGGGGDTPAASGFGPVDQVTYLALEGEAEINKFITLMARADEPERVKLIEAVLKRTQFLKGQKS